METHLAFALENPELFQLMFERPVPRFVPSQQGLEAMGELMALMERITSDAIASGTLIASLSPDVIMNMFMAFAHGLTSQHLANEPHLPAGEGRFGSLIPPIMQVLKKAWS
jgi:hypothetical protein